MVVDVFVRTGGQPQLCADRPKAFQQGNKVLRHIRRIEIIPQFAGLLPLRQQAGNGSADSVVTLSKPLTKNRARAVDNIRDFDAFSFIPLN